MREYINQYRVVDKLNEIIDSIRNAPQKSLVDKLKA